MLESLDLDDAWEGSYQAAGLDQLILANSSTHLVRALANAYVADAARLLAEFLTTGNTVYARFHNEHLTEAVLDRS